MRPSWRGGARRASTIKRLAALGVEVVVLQLGKLELTSPTGKLMLASWLLSLMERDLIIERTQAQSRAEVEGGNARQAS